MVDTLACKNCGTANFPSNVLCKECGCNLRTGESSIHPPQILQPLREQPKLVIPSVAAVIESSPGLTSGKRVILALSWIGVIGCIGLSALSYVGGLAGATTVFQQIGTIANSLLLVVAPYCLRGPHPRLLDWTEELDE